MSRFIFVTWNGGGNLAPALGIARVLAERRHIVEFLGDESQRQHIASASLAFTAYAEPQSQEGGVASTSPRERQVKLLQDVWMNDQLANDLLALLAHEPADMVIVDCMLAGVLARSADFGAPTAVLVHSLYEPVLALRDAMVMMGNQLRVRSGRAAIDLPAVQWERKDLVVVTTLQQFDGATSPAPNVRYVGPVLDRTSAAAGWSLPWDSNDRRPLVVCSFSTMPGQTAPVWLRMVLDALADRPVRLLLASGPIPPQALHVPANAAVYTYIPHMAVLPWAALAINHAGHGSVMAALANGVPLVCIPGLGADQSLVAQRVEALGAGRTVSSETPAAELRRAVKEVLATRSYREASERLAALIRADDGAATGASVLETASGH